MSSKLSKEELRDVVRGIGKNIRCVLMGRSSLAVNKIGFGPTAERKKPYVMIRLESNTYPYASRASLVGDMVSKARQLAVAEGALDRPPLAVIIGIGEEITDTDFRLAVAHEDG